MKQTTFSKKSLIDFLAEIQGNPEDCLTVYITPSSFRRSISDLLETLPFANEVAEAFGTEAVFREAQRYGTGLVIFWSERKNRLFVLPPFTVPEDKVVQGRPHTMPLCDALQRERTVGFVLVTWGSYALGVFQGDNLVESKIGTGYIHKPHRKGGRSQKRFARRTEEQKKDFLRKVANRTEERFRAYPLEQVFFGGNRLILKPLLQECPYLGSQVDRISKRLLTVRYADREALLGSLEDVYRSLVFSF